MNRTMWRVPVPRWRSALPVQSRSGQVAHLPRFDGLARLRSPGLHPIMSSACCHRGFGSDCSQGQTVSPKLCAVDCRQERRSCRLRAPEGLGTQSDRVDILARRFPPSYTPGAWTSPAADTKGSPPTVGSGLVLLLTAAVGAAIGYGLACAFPLSHGAGPLLSSRSSPEQLLLSHEPGAHQAALAVLGAVILSFHSLYRLAGVHRGPVAGRRRADRCSMPILGRAPDPP